MKKIIAMFIALTMCLSLCACSEIEKNDAGFITNLSSALNARWKLSSNETATDADSYKANLTKYVNAELEKLGSYSEYTFADQELAELAEQYFEALNTQLEGIPFYGIDDAMYRQLFTSEGYNRRAKILYLIHSNYGLSINDRYASTLNDFLSFGKKVNDVDNILTQELTLVNKGNACELVIENTSNYDLSNSVLTFNLMDDSDVIVCATPVYIERWAAGSKFRAEVWTNNQDFTHAEMNIEDYANGIKTDFVPISYVNEMIIDIVADELPTEVNHGYNNRVSTSCIVNAFKYEVGYWDNGAAGVNLYFSGTKTYDEDGENGANYCNFTYNILDENNVVVDSGNVYVESIKVNDSFKDVETYSSKIEPGSYRIVVMDDMY